jgi:hypothetical protein
MVEQVVREAFHCFETEADEAISPWLTPQRLFPEGWQ